MTTRNERTNGSWKKSLVLAGALGLLAPAPAWGQSAAPAGTAEPPTVAIVGGETAAAAAVSATTLAALEERLVTAEQRASAAEQRADTIEKKLDGAKPGAVVGANDKGFVFQNSDGSYALKLKGLVAFDSRKYVDDPALTAGDGFLVRKIRPVFDITVLRIVDLRFIIDFAQSSALVLDAYVDVKPTPWLKIRAGKFIAPVGLERNQQDPELPFMERSLTSNLTSVRDVGLYVHGDVAGGVFGYAAGVVDGAPDNALVDLDNNQGKDLVGRAVVRPFALPALQRFGTLGVGISGSSGTRRGQPAAGATGLAPYRTSGQTIVFQYATSATDPTLTTYADQTQQRLNPLAYYFVGSFGLLGEYSLSSQTVRQGANQAKLTHQAWHATVNYVIGGRATLNGAVVNQSFDPSRGTFGALELAARYGELRIDPDTFPTFANSSLYPQTARGIGGAASWYLSRNFRVSANYEQTLFSAAPAAAGTFVRPSEKVLLARTQVLF